MSVEAFHMLPYVDVLSAWITVPKPPNSSTTEVQISAGGEYARKVMSAARVGLLVFAGASSPVNVGVR